MHLLPIPKRIQQSDGVFFLSPHTEIVIQDRNSALIRTASEQLQNEIKTAGGIEADILAGCAQEGDISLSCAQGLPAQGYRLTISPQQIILVGGTCAGVLHGVQTLRQIIRQYGCTLPAVTIEDSPDLPVRGFYHDVTRGRVPTLAYLKQLADEACLYKINQLQLYIEHTYLFRDLSELGMVGDTLTAQEIMALDDYCAERGIELVPSLSTFGHLLELLRTKTYAPLCEYENAEEYPSTMSNRMYHLTINPEDPRSYDLITGMIDEFMQLFRSRLFNICADETFDLGKGRNQILHEQIGEKGLYMGFVKKICQHVVSRGRVPMFWGDIVIRFADALTELPPETICLNWSYSPTVEETWTRTLSERGAKQYVCPGVWGWNQVMNRMRCGWDNISRMASYGKKYGAIGLLNTDWGDYGHINDPRFSLPGMIYGAQHSWSSAEVTFEQVNEGISVLAYGDHSGKILSIIAGMENCDVYRWRDLAKNKEYIQGVFHEDEPVPLTIANHDLYQTVAEANAALDKIIIALKQSACSMGDNARHMIQCWLIAAEGIQLWNLVAEKTVNHHKDAALAAQLENWYHLYERMWREVSKESELWRIRDMVRWYTREVLR